MPGWMIAPALSFGAFWGWMHRARSMMDDEQGRAHMRCVCVEERTVVTSLGVDARCR